MNNSLWDFTVTHTVLLRNTGHVFEQEHSPHPDSARTASSDCHFPLTEQSSPPEQIKHRQT